MRLYGAVLAFIASVAINGFATAGKNQLWNVDDPKLSRTIGKGLTRSFSALIRRDSQQSSTRIEIPVPFTESPTLSVVDNTLVLMGPAGNTDAVVIFDLLTNMKVDSFYCYQPQLVWDHWIVYVEWYPNHIPDPVTDVVLVYDLSTDPRGNRIESNRPPSDTRVGFPVFPDRNAREKSYDNIVENQADVKGVIGPPHFLAMPDHRLVFLASEEPGGDATSIKNYIVVADLSRGVRAASVRTISIPEESLKRKPANPGFVKVTGIETAADGKVRLAVPKDQYGVEAIVVELPRS